MLVWCFGACIVLYMLQQSPICPLLLVLYIPHAPGPLQFWLGACMATASLQQGASKFNTSLLRVVSSTHRSNCQIAKWFTDGGLGQTPV